MAELVSAQLNAAQLSQHFAMRSRCAVVCKQYCTTGEVMSYNSISNSQYGSSREPSVCMDIHRPIHPSIHTSIHQCINTDVTFLTSSEPAPGPFPSPPSPSPPPPPPHPSLPHVEDFRFLRPVFTENSNMRNLNKWNTVIVLQGHMAGPG